MTRLADIIDGATGDVVSVPSLLRMVKVVASRPGTAPLEEWVAWELDGYADESDVPPYRGPFAAPVKGHFTGPLGSNIQDMLIPSIGLPVAYRDGWMFKVVFLQPVSELEDLSKSGGNLQNPWDADVVALVNQMLTSGEARLIPMHGLVSAYKVVTSAQIRAVLDAVRNRVLNLALALEKIAPRAGELDAEIADLPAVANIVYNNIYGSGTNVSAFSPHTTQSSYAVQEGDLNGLLVAASSAGLTAEEVDRLRGAIEEDASEANGETGPGSRVQGFLGRLALGAASAGGNVTAAAAGDVIGGMVRGYYGIS